MNTRSKTKQESIIVESVLIDFDGASEAWRHNKKSMGNGCYKYKCLVEKNGGHCGKICYKNTLYCWQHRNRKMG